MRPRGGSSTTDTTARPRPTALVTGASSGIGAAFARTLAAQNCNPILVARRQSRLALLAGDLQRRFGFEAEIMVADLVSCA